MFQSLRQAGTLLLLLAAPVCGQFVELATTDDGSQLYFSSIMLLKGRDGGRWLETRVYRHSAGGLTLYAERGERAPENSGSPTDGVSNPSVSGDGSVVAVSYTGLCNDNECIQPFSEVEVRGRDTLTLTPGQPQISRNGRWALITKSFFTDSTSTLVDLSSGRQTVTLLHAPFTPGAGGGAMGSLPTGHF